MDTSADGYNNCSHIQIIFLDQPERAITIGQFLTLYRQPKSSVPFMDDPNNNCYNQNSIFCSHTLTETVGGGKITAAGPSYWDMQKEVPDGIDFR